MVGVAGKSKACNTCRKRRVKCDLRRPSCAACLKFGRTCGGYERSLIYVNRTTQSPLVTATDVLSNLRRKQVNVDGLEDHQGATADLHNLFLEPSAVRKNFRVYAIELLRDYYLPQAQRFETTAATFSQGSYSWVHALSSLTGPSAALDVALFALCLTQIYITGSGSTTLAKCLDWYNDALQYLRRDLSNSQMHMTDETLAAVIVISTVELFITSDDGGWTAHARGIASIIKARSLLASDRTPMWKHLLSRFRVICTLEALTKREAQILESSVWRLSEIEVDMVGPLDELYNTIADVPAVLERADSLAHETDFGRLVDGASTVMNKLLQAMQRIDEWFKQYRAQSTSPLWWSVPSVITSVADASPSEKLFPFAIEFPSLSVQIAVTQVWALKTIILSDIIQLYDLVTRQCSHMLTLGAILHRTINSRQEAASTLLSLRDGNQQDTHMDSLTIEQVREEATRLARLLCQAMEYAHRIEQGTMGVQVTTFSRWTIRHYFRFHAGHERELLWATELAKNVGPGTRWDYDMMVFTPLKGPLGSR